MVLICNFVLLMILCCFVIYRFVGYVLNIVKRYYYEDNIVLFGDFYSFFDGLREGFGFFFFGLYIGFLSLKISRKLVFLELIFYLIILALVRLMFEIVELVLLGLVL